jgi:hypothetical protein
MRILIVAMTLILLTAPAYSQAGGGGMGGGRGGGRGGQPSEPAGDQAKKKADEKAFNDAVSRIPVPEKKFDPWGTVRDAGKK